jgi:hypothetical protein
MEKEAPMTAERPGKGKQSAMRPRDTRKTALKGGQLIIGSELLDCFVLNMSDTGARVSFRAPVELPEAVILKLGDGSTYPALRIWARETEVGLQFTAAPGAAASRAGDISGAPWRR